MSERAHRARASAMLRLRVSDERRPGGLLRGRAGACLRGRWTAATGRLLRLLEFKREETPVFASGQEAASPLRAKSFYVAYGDRVRGEQAGSGSGWVGAQCRGQAQDRQRAVEASRVHFD